METAFVSIICIALLVIGGMTMSRGFLTSLDNTSINMDSISQRNEEIMRTNLNILEVSQLPANVLQVRISNTGQVKLADYSRWDVIVHYMDSGGIYSVTWMPYTISSPGSSEWTVDAIYTESGMPEVFEPNIFNPDEEMVLEIKLAENIKKDSENLVVLTTPNGVTVTKSFTGT